MLKKYLGVNAAVSEFINSCFFNPRPGRDELDSYLDLIDIIELGRKLGKITGETTEPGTPGALTFYFDNGTSETYFVHAPYNEYTLRFNPVPGLARVSGCFQSDPEQFNKPIRVTVTNLAVSVNFSDVTEHFSFYGLHDLRGSSVASVRAYFSVGCNFRNVTDLFRPLSYVDHVRVLNYDDVSTLVKCRVRTLGLISASKRAATEYLVRALYMNVCTVSVIRINQAEHIPRKILRLSNCMVQLVIFGRIPRDLLSLVMTTLI